MNGKVVALLGISLLILAGLVGLADIGELKEILGSADPLMVVLSALSYTLAITFFAVIWQLLIGSARLELRFIDNLRLVFSSVFFNVVTPTASYGGEAVRAYLLTKKFNQDTGVGAATIVAHRIIGTLSNSAGTLILGLYLITRYAVPPVLLVIILVVTLSSFIGFVVVLYFGLKIEWSTRFAEKIFNLIGRFREVTEEKRESVNENLMSYHEGLSVLLKSRGTLIYSMLLGLVAWFFVNLVAVLAFKAVGGTISVENFLLIFTFFSVSRLIPTGLPEFVGSKEAILAALYAASGLPVSTSVAVIILIRLATQLWMILLGGAVTLQLGFEGFREKA
ncbi:MAG TPA: flippase-like domain-containing protein [Euryarchaeota archaeon]|nr:hypothetical protein BMS3Bbin16_00282 [archaeon BMS3Bbin16]HDH28432.1 flippase-like domain-containing protein [Euryarchaeota archaeon]